MIPWAVACTRPNPSFLLPGTVDGADVSSRQLDSAGPDLREAGGVLLDARDASSDGGRVDVVQPPDVAPVVLPAPLAHWRFDETGGKSAADEAGGRTATLSTNATFASPGFPAKFTNRGAVAVDGNSYVTLNGTGLTRLNQPMTISYWMFVPAATLPLVNRKNVLVLVSPGQSLQLGVQNGYATAWRSAASPIFLSSPTLVAGWHHFAYTINGTTQSLYLEGTGHHPAPEHRGDGLLPGHLRRRRGCGEIQRSHRRRPHLRPPARRRPDQRPGQRRPVTRLPSRPPSRTRVRNRPRSVLL